MEQSEFLSIISDAIFVTIMISLPILLVTLGIGLAIGILQAVTQIQEATLTFVPKILLTFITLIYAIPWMTDVLTNFTVEMINKLGPSV